MGYIKQNFVPNQTLTAEELNMMDNQISANEVAIESVKASVKASQESKQDKLVSGTNIKTINGQTILGPGNITIEGGNGTVDTSNLATKSELNAKQDKLVSGTNIKTINGQSIVGSGNIEIEGGAGGNVDLSGYATEKWVKGQNYTTKTYVDSEIAKVQTGDATIDLSEYAKKSELPTKVSELDNDSKYTTESWVSAEITKAQLGGGNGEVNLDGFATEQWVNDQGFLKEHQDISHLAKKSELPSKVSQLENDSKFVTDKDINSLVKDVQVDGVSITKNGIANISKIEFKGDKGDKGDTGAQGIQGPKGDNGTSVTIKGSFASVEELKAAYEAYLGGDSSGFNGDLLTGDGYLVNGELYVYDGARNAFESSWENVGKIKGEDGISLFKSTAFTRSNETPDTPVGGNWDSPIPENEVDGKAIWSDGIPDGEEILWSTTRTFSYKNSELESNWSTPVKMVDTVNFEVIYGTTSADITNLPPLPITEGLTNYTGWYDNDTDITNNEDIKWMATATCKNGVWSNWKVTQIKGEKGDTPIVKFTSIVFRRTNDILTNADTPSGGDFDNPKPNGDVWSDGIPSGTEILWSSNRVFSNDGNHSSWTIPIQMTDTANFEVIYGIEDARTEDLPTLPVTEGFASKGWYDDIPVGVEVMWMATATCKNGVWSNWKVTQIKGENGKDGVAKFKSTIFVRSQEKPANPVGGDWENPVPAGWYDGIPAEDENNYGRVWTSSKMFYDDDRATDDWTTPTVILDTADFEAVYCPLNDYTSANPTPFYRDADGIGISNWKKENPNWTDDGATESIWMATTTRKNGEWSDWTITRIRGEKGDPGKDGTNGKDGKDGSSVKILGTLTSSDDLKTITKKESGDGYLIDGNLWVFTNASGDGTVAGFINVGKIKGEDGKDGIDGAQVYLHIKYATKVTLGDNWKPTSAADVTLTANNGETPGPWMGQYSDYNDKDSDNVLDYTWFSVDAQNAVATEIGKYKITSNSILGKTITSIQEVDLVQGTSYTEINDDGTLGDKELTSSTGPAWQISDSGQGHLAKGNIRWDKNGNVEFGPNVVLKWSAGIDEAKSAAQGAADAAATAQNAADAAQATATEAKNSIPDADYITNISKNAITTEFLNTKEITAKDISADKITGKTLQSSDATNAAWRLNSDGSGRLANGNITWKSDGTVDFGSNVKLKWDNVKDAVDGNIEIPEGYTEEDIKGFATEITNNTVNTAFVNALKVTADSLTANAINSINIKADQITSGTIDSKLINVDDINVTQLDTKSSAGNLVKDQVRIKENEIIVTGDDYTGLGLNAKPVLRVSGNALDNSIEDFDPIDLTIRSSTDTIDRSIVFSPSLSNAVLEKKYKLSNLSSLGLGNLDIDNTSISNKIRLYSANNSRLTCTINITNWALKETGGASGLLGASGSTSLSIGIRCCASDVDYSYNIAQLMINDGKFDNVIKGQPGTTSRTIEVPFETICEKAKADDAALYLIVKCDKGVNVGNLTISITSDKFVSSKLNNFGFKAKQMITNMPNVNITKDHFRYLVDDYNYFDIDNNGYLTYFFNDGVYGIGTDKGNDPEDETKTGLWIKIGDNKFYITELNSTIQTAAKAAEDAKGSYATVASEYTSLNTIINGDGTPSNPGLVSRTEDISVDLYGEDGNSGIKSVATGAQSLAAEALDNATVAQNAAATAQSTADGAQSTADKASKSAGTALTNANTALTNASTAQRAADAANEAAAAANGRLDTVETNIATINNTTPKVFNQSTVFNDVFCKTGSKFALMYISPGKTPVTMFGSYSPTGIQKMHYSYSYAGGIYFKNITDMPTNTTICVSTNTFTVDDVKYLVEPIDNLIFAESTNSAGAKINKVHGSLGVVTTSSKSVSGPIRITNMDTGATVICELKVTIGGVA